MDNKDSEVDTTDREEDTPAPEDGADDSDDIASQLTKVKSGAYSGQICTLKTLIDDDIVKTGDAVLSLEYMVSRHLTCSLKLFNLSRFTDSFRRNCYVYRLMSFV